MEKKEQSIENFSMSLQFLIIFFLLITILILILPCFFSCFTWSEVAYCYNNYELGQVSAGIRGYFTVSTAECQYISADIKQEIEDVKEKIGEWQNVFEGAIQDWGKNIDEWGDDISKEWHELTDEWRKTMGKWEDKWDDWDAGGGW